MKKDNVCPGCHKHCPLNAPRCKYGLSYLAKQEKKKASCSSSKQKHYKWEQYVAQNGPAWKLLTISRNAKKALCRRDITESALFAAFTEEEKQLFAKMLDKLNTGKTDQ